MTLAIDSGKNGLTNVGTLEKAANAFVKAYAGTQGTETQKVSAGVAAAQAAINKSQSSTDRGDMVKIYELKMNP